VAALSNELRVPTHATDAEIHCADGRVFVGRIFIPEASSHHSGAMRPDEWFNEGGSFFAFLPDDAKATVVLNKRQVAVLTVPAPLEEPVEDAESAPPLRRVVLELVDRRVEGQLLIDMPLGQRRVLDVLNCPESFLIVRAGDRWHLVRKSLITRVVEIQEG
jgi:hypothetical protein